MIDKIFNHTVSGKQIKFNEQKQQHYVELTSGQMSALRNRAYEQFNHEDDPIVHLHTVMPAKKYVVESVVVHAGGDTTMWIKK